MEAAKSAIVTLLTSALVLGLCGCEEPPPRPKPPRPATEPAPAGPVWTAEQVAVIEGMDVPESVVVDPATGAIYVSNVEAGEGQYWADDGKGFISRLLPNGKLDRLRWKSGGEEFRLNAPKGMCVYGGAVYVADNKRVCRLAVDPAGAEGPVMGLQGERLNDVATNGAAVYVSDTAAGKIYRIDGPAITELKAPEGVNGITFHGDKMYAVSFALHDLFEIDPEGKADPKPFGLAGHFKALDGIEVLDDGTFIVSDFEGDRVCTVSPDRQTVHTLCTPKTPADIGLGRRSGLMYVPQFMHKSVVTYKLAKK